MLLPFISLTPTTTGPLYYGHVRQWISSSSSDVSHRRDATWYIELFQVLSWHINNWPLPASSCNSTPSVLRPAAAAALADTMMPRPRPRQQQSCTPTMPPHNDARPHDYTATSHLHINTMSPWRPQRRIITTAHEVSHTLAHSLFKTIVWFLVVLQYCSRISGTNTKKS